MFRQYLVFTCKELSNPLQLVRGVLHSVCVDCISKIVPIACIEHGTHFIRVNAINSEIRILVIMARMQYYWNDSIGGASVDICDYGLSFS